MSSPLRANRRSPRPPRSQDDWFPLLIGLGTVGGLAGWLAATGFAPLQPNATTLVAPSQTLVNPSAPIAEGQRQTPTVSSATTEGDRATNRPRADQNTPDSLSNDVITDTVKVPDPKVPESRYPSHLAPIRSPLPFPDVPNGYWAKPYIDALTARGVLNGLPDGTFNPNRPMTRAELAVQVAKAFEIQADPAGTKVFSDVGESYWAAATIRESVSSGFMTGYPDGFFLPEQTVPRVQVLTTLVTGLSLSPPPAMETDRLLQQYSDQAAIPDWAREKVAAAIQAGIISPSPDTALQLRPNEPATRAEVATLIYNALAYMGVVAEDPQSATQPE